MIAADLIHLTACYLLGNLIETDRKHGSMRLTCSDDSLADLSPGCSSIFRIDVEPLETK